MRQTLRVKARSLALLLVVGATFAGCSEARQSTGGTHVTAAWRSCAFVLALAANPTEGTFQPLSAQEQAMMRLRGTPTFAALIRSSNTAAAYGERFVKHHVSYTTLQAKYADVQTKCSALAHLAASN